MHIRSAAGLRAPGLTRQSIFLIGFFWMDARVIQYKDAVCA
jgi:hypothetical protein